MAVHRMCQIRFDYDFSGYYDEIIVGRQNLTIKEK
jgi:hypothetical protein